MDVARVTSTDHQELMDFMHRSFLTAKPRHSRFEALYPDLYRPTRESMHRHRVIRDNGKIVASAGIFPIRLRMGSVTLDVAALGGVCTAPEYRRRGMMKELARFATELLYRDGCPLSWLSGDRSRYAPFGYEKAGSTPQALLTIEDKQLPSDDWIIEKVNPGNADVESMVAGLEQRACSGLTDPVTFRLKIKRLRNEIWQARHRDVAQPRYAFLVTLPQVGWIGEWGGDPEGVEQLLRAALDADTSWHMHLPVIEDAYSPSFMSRIDAQTYHLDNLAIFSLERLIERYEPYLADVWPKGRTLTLVIESKRCTLAEGRIITPEPETSQLLRVSRLKLARLLFGPERPSQHVDLSEEIAWLDEVLPLPFYMPWLFRV